MAVNTQLNTATVPLPVFKNVVNISSAQVLAMYTTPVLLVPSPGANKVIFVHDAFVEYAYGGVAYSNGSGFLLQYGNAGSGGGTEIVVSSNINPNASASDFAGDPGTPYNLTGVTSDMVNNGVYATTGINNFTAGTGTFRVFVCYTIVSTTA